VPDAIAQAPHDGIDIGDERIYGIAVRPPAAVLQRLRQIRMMQANERRDAGLQQPIRRPAAKGLMLL
jgi:hypothetical protein